MASGRWWAAGYRASRSPHCAHQPALRGAPPAQRGVVVAHRAGSDLGARRPRPFVVGVSAWRAEQDVRTAVCSTVRDAHPSAVWGGGHVVAAGARPPHLAVPLWAAGTPPSGSKISDTAPDRESGPGGCAGWVTGGERCAGPGDDCRSFKRCTPPPRGRAVSADGAAGVGGPVACRPARPPRPLPKRTSQASTSRPKQRVSPAPP